jgi:putative transposase
MFKPAVALTISWDDTERLQQLVRTGKTPQKVALRARIILAAVEGQPNNAIAKTLKITRPTVLLWRSRFQEFGVLGLMKSAKRQGRKRKVTINRTDQERHLRPVAFAPVSAQHQQNLLETR